MSTARKHDDGQLPDGWRMVRLGELVGASQGGTPRKEESSYWDGNIPFLTGADLTDFRVSREHARSFLTDFGLDSGQTAVCEPGALLLATRTRVGLAAMATELMGASQDITCLHPNEHVHSEFLCRNLLRLAPELQRLSRGTTIQGITREDVNSVLIVLPPLPEQRAIADMLDSIDEAIERTEAIIAATETLRDSLLHELLTRGVPGWHTEWKDVAGIGTIPSDWEVVRLDEIADVVGGSTPSRGIAEFWDGTIPWVVPSELTGLAGRFLSTTNETITDAGMKSAGLQLLPAGSVLLTSRATVGATAINLVPVVTNQGFQNLVVKDGTDKLWLYYRISSMHRELERRAAGSTFLEVSRDSVRSLAVALPPIAEQRAVSATLDCVDSAIETARAERDALRSHKDSVADVLLNGRVRTG